MRLRFADQKALRFRVGNHGETQLKQQQNEISMNTRPTTNQTSTDGLIQVRRDLISSFQHFPLASLLHLKANFGRLIRGHYKRNGGGCIFHLLSEVLPERIESRMDLISYFTGQVANDCNDAVYLAPKHVVKVWDGDLSLPQTVSRYPGVEKLGRALLKAVLLEAIEMRLPKKTTPVAKANVARTNPARTERELAAA